MNESFSFDKLSIDLKAAARLAAKILSGARTNLQPNNIVEVVSCGSTERVPKTVYDIALKAAQECDRVFLAPQGYNPPFLDYEGLFRAVDFIQESLYRNLNEHRLKVFFIQNSESGCGYWRCEEPVAAMLKKFPGQIYAESGLEVDYTALLPFDIIVVQRGLFAENTTAIFTIVEKLKAGGKKLIYEVDDDIDGVHVANASLYEYTPEVRRFTAWLKDQADAIFVTNEALKKVVGYEDKTFILPNSLDYSKFRLPKREEGRENFLHILWHGGDSHEVDINWMQKPLTEFIATKKSRIEDKTGKMVVVNFLGYLPKFLEDYLNVRVRVGAPKVTLHKEIDPDLNTPIYEYLLKGRENVRFLKPVPVHDFHQHLINIQPDITICPLHPTLEMNLAKSNIKFLESTLAGAASVVTNVGPFTDIPEDCAIKARTPEQMIQGLMELALSEEKRSKMVSNAKIWSETNFDLNQNVDLWVDALYKVAGMSPLE